MRGTERKGHREGCSGKGARGTEREEGAQESEHGVREHGPREHRREAREHRKVSTEPGGTTRNIS